MVCGLEGCSGMSVGIRRSSLDLMAHFFLLCCGELRWTMWVMKIQPSIFGAQYIVGGSIRLRNILYTPQVS